MKFSHSSTCSSTVLKNIDSSICSQFCDEFVEEEREIGFPRVSIHPDSLTIRFRMIYVATIQVFPAIHTNALARGVCSSIGSVINQMMIELLLYTGLPL